MSSHHAGHDNGPQAGASSHRSSAHRGCQGLCVAGCPLLPGAPPHHHHGQTCLWYDPLPYSAKRAWSLGRALLGAVPLSAERLGEVVQDELAGGEFISWAPAVESDDALAAWIAHKPDQRTRPNPEPIQPPAPPVAPQPAAPQAAATWKGTSLNRGCQGAVNVVSGRVGYCKQSGHGVEGRHHHHEGACLMYDVWPYDPDRQRDQAEIELGVWPVRQDMFRGLNATAVPAHRWAGNNARQGTVSEQIVVKSTLDRERSPTQKERQAAEEDARRNEWFARNGLLRQSDVVRRGTRRAPQETKAMPREQIGELPPLSGRPEVDKFGCPKMSFRSANAAWNALVRTLEVDGDDPDLGFYRCDDLCGLWHLGHADDPDRTQPLEFSYRLMSRTDR